MNLLLIVSPIVGVLNCSMFCCTLLYVHSSFAIILIGKRERGLVALLSLSFWCFVIVVWLILAVRWGLSAVCDCGIPWSYSLAILNALNLLNINVAIPWGFKYNLNLCKI